MEGFPKPFLGDLFRSRVSEPGGCRAWGPSPGQCRLAGHPQEAGLLQEGGPIFTRIQMLAEQRGKSLTSLRI